MLYDISKLQDIDVSRIVASWNDSNVSVAGMKREPDENETKLMNCYFWSDFFQICKKIADDSNKTPQSPSGMGNQAIQSILIAKVFKDLNN